MPDTGIKIRPMEAADVDGALKVVERAYKLPIEIMDKEYGNESPSVCFRAFAINSSVSSEERQGLEDALHIIAGSVKYFVAEKNGQIIGTSGIYSVKDDYASRIGATKPNDENVKRLQGNTQTAWLGWLCIDPGDKNKGLPSYQGQGISPELIKASVQEAIDRAKKEGKDIGNNHYAIYADNAAAASLYEKFGAKRHCNVKPEGQDELEGFVLSAPLSTFATNIGLLTLPLP